MNEQPQRTRVQCDVCRTKGAATLHCESNPTRTLIELPEGWAWSFGGYALCPDARCRAVFSMRLPIAEAR